MPAEDDGTGGAGEPWAWRDPWTDPTEADLSLTATVDKISSRVSAMCHGRFGQHVLVGTTNGEVNDSSIHEVFALFDRYRESGKIFKLATNE